MPIDIDKIRWFNQFGNQVLLHLCRHTVAIRWLHSLKTPRSEHSDLTRAFDVQSELASAFLIAAGNFCFLMTAGHRISKLNETTSGPRKLIKSHLHIGMHLDNKDENILLPLADMPVFHADNEALGIDYGAFLLPVDVVSSFMEQGTTPVQEIAWREPIADPDFWVMLGFPNEQREKDRFVDGTITREPLRFGTPLLPLERIYDPESYSLDTPFDRFYARIISKSGPILLIDINGMSGGPIFAIKANGNEYRYELVAVQSTWNAHEIVAGCFVKPFIDAVLRKLQDWK